MKYLKLIIMSFILSLSMHLSTIAGGSLDDLRVRGVKIVDEDILKDIENGLNTIPQEILQYHKNTSKSIILVNGKINGLGDNVAGVYYVTGPENDNIYIRSDMKFYSNYKTTSPSNVVVHEFGHFIYYRWLPSMNDEELEYANQLFSYWEKYRPDCYNVEECFAALYATYKLHPDYLNNDTKDFFQSAENFVVRISKGPGGY